MRIEGHPALIGGAGVPRSVPYPMHADAAPRSAAARALLWWILWAGAIAALVAIDYAMRQVSAASPGLRSAGLDAVALVDLLVSCLARWWVLPRVQRVQTAFVLFVVGVAMAESCGLIGIFGGVHRNELFMLGLAGVLQWLPVFARRFAAPAAPAV